MPEIPENEIKNLERMHNFETSRPGVWKQNGLPQNWIELEALVKLVKHPSISHLTKDESFLKEVRKGIEIHEQKFRASPRLMYSLDNLDLPPEKKEELHKAAESMFNEEERLLALAITYPSIISHSEYRHDLEDAEDSLLKIADKIGEQFMEKRKQEGRELYSLIHKKLKDNFTNVSLDEDNLSIGPVNAAKINYHLGRLEVNPDTEDLFGKLLDISSLPTVGQIDMLGIPLGKGRVLGVGPVKNNGYKAIPFSTIYEALLKKKH